MPIAYPFQGEIQAGASTYNQYGIIPWGPVEKKFKTPLIVTIIAEVGDKYKIGSPLWPDNGKEWTTPKVNVTPVTVPPPVEPPTPEPTAKEIPVTIILGDNITYAEQKIVTTIKPL